MRWMFLLALGVLVLAGRGASAQTMAERYASLLAEHEVREKEWSSRFEKLNLGLDAPPALLEARYQTWPNWESARRLLELAEEKPDDPAAIDALCWVIKQSLGVGVMDRQISTIHRRAVEMLESRNGFDDDRTRELFRHALGYPASWTEHYLRSALQKARSKEIRGLACLSLARLLEARAELSVSPWFDKPEKKPFEAFLVQRFDAEVAAYCRTADVKATRAEALLLFDRAIDEFGDRVYAVMPEGRGEVKIERIARTERDALREKIASEAKQEKPPAP